MQAQYDAPCEPTRSPSANSPTCRRNLPRLDSGSCYARLRLSPSRLPSTPWAGLAPLCASETGTNFAYYPSVAVKSENETPESAMASRMMKRIFLGFSLLAAVHACVMSAGAVPYLYGGAYLAAGEQGQVILRPGHPGLEMSAWDPTDLAEGRFLRSGPGTNPDRGNSGRSLGAAGWDFMIFYTYASGTLTYGADFNHDGVFHDTVAGGPELVTWSEPSWAGQGFQQLALTLPTAAAGYLNSRSYRFALNGSDLEAPLLDPASGSVGTPGGGNGWATYVFQETSGGFGNILLTGHVALSDSSSDLDPLAYISFSTLQLVRVPDAGSPLALLGAALAGLAVFRCRQCAG